MFSLVSIAWMLTQAPVSPLTARKGLQVPTHRGRHKKARRSGLRFILLPGSLRALTLYARTKPGTETI